mmetsp:Transcript_10803/g.23431  ORF Transcript_10803/g.23431 Transcript_10803/m.23431 type:complete len:223 (-) Transcript_10803:444-1112(-)
MNKGRRDPIVATPHVVLDHLDVRWGELGGGHMTIAEFEPQHVGSVRSYAVDREVDAGSGVPRGTSRHRVVPVLDRGDRGVDPVEVLGRRVVERFVHEHARASPRGLGGLRRILDRQGRRAGVVHGFQSAPRATIVVQAPEVDLPPGHDERLLREIAPLAITLFVRLIVMASEVHVVRPDEVKLQQPIRLRGVLVLKWFHYQLPLDEDKGRHNFQRRAGGREY